MFQTDASRWRRGVRAPAVAAVLLVVVATGPAYAEGLRDAVTGIVIHTDGGLASQSVAIRDLYPGAHQESIVFFDGEEAQTVRTVALDVTKLRDLEHGCNRPELNTHDVTCGAGGDQGELSSFLEMALAPGVEMVGAEGDRRCAVDSIPTEFRALGEIERFAVDRPGNASQEAVMCLSATFRHAVKGTSDNLTQTDSVLFDLEVHFEIDRSTAHVLGEANENKVLGLAAERDAMRALIPASLASPGGTLTLGLADTGAPLSLLLGAALLLGTAGTLVIRTLARGGSA